MPPAGAPTTTRPGDGTVERFDNLVAMFLARATALGDAPFLLAKQDGAWTPTSWHDSARQVASLAAALRVLGLAPGDRVMLVSENRPEWCLSDLAIMAAGGVTVPAYVTNTVADHAHVAADSGATIAILSGEKVAATLLPALAAAPAIRYVIAIEPVAPPPGMAPPLDWQALIAAHDAAPASIAADAARGDLACIIYTSGTGGRPRGVMQHHGAILHNVEGCASIIAGDFAPSPGGEVFLSLLPLSHAYEHSAGQFLPIGLGARIHYAEGLEKLASNIAEVRPTVMVVVPRLFEVLRTRITKGIEKKGGISERLFRRALALRGRRRRRRDTVLRLAIDRLLKPRIARRFGGRLKAMVSGGAPLNAEVGGFFEALGLTVLQGYGQTEAGPVVSCNRPAIGIRLDTVGPPLTGTEVRVADDGELLVRGENVMHGYWRDEADSARALAGGWLHTGDIGRIDEAGRIVITDRKKDLIVNDKGENVAPQKVEGALTLQPEIAQAMIHGDRRPHMVAVIVPDQEWTQRWCAANGQGCRAETLAESSAYRTAIGQAVERVNARLSVTERVRRFVLADEAFSIANEQMTPSMKIRRHVIRDVYRDRLDALYR